MHYELYLITERKDFAMKKLLAVLLASVMLFAVNACAEDEIKVYVDGEIMTFDTPPELINDRTMVPMRAIFEKLGATVSWNDEFMRAEGLFENGKHVMLYIDKNTAYVDGELKILDASPYLKDERTMIPLRFVAEGGGAKVKWEDETQSVYITPSYHTGEFIPFGEYMTIPSPISADRNFELLDYYKENDVSFFKFDLTKVESDVVAKYDEILISRGFKMVKGTKGDKEKILYNGTCVVDTKIEDGVYNLKLYTDSSGSTISEYLE